MRFQALFGFLLMICASAANSQQATSGAAASAAAGAVASGGPLQLLITYRSEPAKRPAFRSYWQGEGHERFEKLKRDGVIKGYQVLFNPFVSSNTWDALAILSFARYADTRRWMELERTSPGGLTAAGLKLAKPLDTISADLAWEGGADGAASEKDSVYYVIPYEYNVLDQYRKYVDAYVIPQVKGWVREGVLSSYRIYMNRASVGPLPDALFVYQYRDLEAFGHRDETVAKVRKTLVDDPLWKMYSDIKQTIRSESENTVAEQVR